MGKPVKDSRYRIRQTGLGMLEVLVATLVFSVGILGIAGMQVSGMKVTKSAHNLSVATQIAEDMADRLRANLAGVQDLAYDGVCVCSNDSCTGCDTSACPDKVDNPSAAYTRSCFGADCTSASAIKAADLADWKFLMCSEAPPGTSASISCNACTADSPRTIRVAWREAERIEDSVNPGSPLYRQHDVTIILHPFSPHQ
jgi:type IV pilus modification protein PilV